MQYKKRYILVITLFVSLVLVGGFAFATTPPITDSSLSFISIPKEIRNLVEEKDWVELVCYEAESQGREAITSFRTMGEEVAIILESSKEIFVIEDVPNFVGISDELESLLEKICQASSVEEAEPYVKEFSVNAHEFKKLAQGDFALRVRSSFKKKADELKVNIESQLNGELENLKSEAQENLNSRTEAEATKFKTQIESELKAEIDKSILNGEFNDASSGKKLSEEKVKEKVVEIAEERESKARLELQSKYELIGEEEERLYRDKLKTKADELGGETKKKLEEIRGQFNILDEKIKKEIADNQKIKTNRQNATNKKRDIYKKIIEHYFKIAIDKIEANREKINDAIKNGIKFDTPEKTIELVGKDYNSALREMSQNNIDEEMISKIFNNLQKTWLKLEEDMSIIEDSASENIIKEFRKNMEYQFSQSEGAIESFKLYFAEAEKFYLSAKNSCDQGQMREYYCPKVDSYKNIYDKAILGKNAINKIIEKRVEVNNLSSDMSRNELVEYGKKLLDELNDLIMIINDSRK